MHPLKVGAGSEPVSVLRGATRLNAYSRRKKRVMPSNNALNTQRQAFVTDIPAHGSNTRTPIGHEMVIKATGDSYIQRGIGSSSLYVNPFINRYELTERFLRKPGINADIQNAAEATREIANPDFEVLGSGGSSDDVTLADGGGIKLETDGGGTNSVIILPHLDVDQSAWTATKWNTNDEVIWEAVIKTGSAITAQVIWAGLKLTNTDAIATDDNSAFFRYEAGVGSGQWQCNVSNVDDATDDQTTNSGVTVAVDTQYHLMIVIDASRIPRFYINGALKVEGKALKANIDLIPYVGILEAAAAAKHMYLRGERISKTYAD